MKWLLSLLLATAVTGKSHATINRDLGKPGDPTTVAVAAFLKSTR